jgi:hypothetical protein
MIVLTSLMPAPALFAARQWLHAKKIYLRSQPNASTTFLLHICIPITPLVFQICSTALGCLIVLIP